VKQYNAKDITVLEGLDPVRKRPGMYIGSTAVKGLNHLVFEIVDNSVDEHLSGYCDKIIITLNKDGSATIEDNGRGIPVDLHAKGYPAERIIFTTLHAGGKFDNSNYKTSGGLHGVGSSVVNALSSKMIVTIKRDGFIHYDEYAYGKPTIPLKKNELLPTKGKTKETGTTVTFYPDETIFDTVKFKASSIEQRLHETAFLNPNLTIIFRNERDDMPEKIFHEKEGLKGFVTSLTKDKDTCTPVAYISGEKDGITFECAFQYINEFGDNLIGFCNNINTVEGGTHIDGFKAGFARILNQYARDIGSLKEKDPNFTGNDTRNGMVCVLSIKHPAPRFEGQTKTKLDNTDARNIIQSILNTELQVFFDRNVDVLKSIIASAEKSAKLRREEEKIKTNIADKKFSFEGNGKLSRQESNDASKCEIFIVEGERKICPYPSFLLSQG
jgi:DNA gyrase subunit B